MIALLHHQVKMVREVIKVSFILIILIQFQTGSYNFLHASQSGNPTVETSKLNRSWDKHNFVDSDMEMNLDNVDVHSLWKNSRKMDQHETLAFEQKLLTLVGLKKRPVRSREKDKIPKYFAKLYEAQINSDIPTSNLNLPGRLTKSANTVRSFYYSGKEPELADGSTHLRFDLTSIPEHEQITGAELRVPFTWPQSKAKNSSVQILVHDIVRIPSRPKSKQTPQDPIMYPVDTKSIKLSTGRNSTFWLTFDVFPAINRWSLNRKQSAGLAVEVIGKGSKTPQPLPVVLQSDNKTKRVKRQLSSDDLNPMLLTYSDDGKNPRKARDAKTLSRHYRTAQSQRRRRNHRHKNRRRNLCSRKKMFVDFTDVGWNDWIVAPPGYQAYYCSGECPFPMAEHLNATNHAVIQALVNSMNPRLVPPPCCVPNKYTSLSLLYTDSSDKIVLKNYKEMVVSSCGCS